MSQSTARDPTGSELPDYLKRGANVVYLFAGILFAGGIWFDWQATGQTVIPMFAIADEPAANSGLFIASMFVLVFGYIMAKSAILIEQRRKVEVDETQEWTVDVGE